MDNQNRRADDKRAPGQLSWVDPSKPAAPASADAPYAAGSELHIGVSNNDQGVHVNIMQRHADGTATVIYTAKAPAGDSYGRASLAAPVAQSTAGAAIPEVLLDGKAVYDELLGRSSRTSAENVSDVLDAVVRLMRRAAPALNPSDAQAPQGEVELIRIPAHEADSYCRILSILGMEEEGDPVAEVQRLFDAEAAQAAPSAPTDLSRRLRASGEAGHLVCGKTLIQAAEEIERYYGGMMAWKRAAEAKDAKFAADFVPAPQALADVRDQALEAAALACDFRARNWGSYLDEPEYVARGEAGQICADAIRFMKSRCATKGAVSDSLGQEGGAA